MAGFRLVSGEWQIRVTAGTTQDYWVDWLKRRVLQSSDQIANVQWVLPSGVTIPVNGEYVQGLKTGAIIATPTVGEYVIECVITTAAPARVFRRSFRIIVE